MLGSGANSPVRVAYLNTKYPSLSHTFIEREIRAVRENGVEVHTFSIRTPAGNDALSEAHREAIGQTHYILKSKWRVMLSQVWGMAMHPLRYLKTIVAGQKLSPAGMKNRALHVAYAMEGVELARELGRRGLMHVQVHMANNGAAVAMLACEFDQTLSYSLTIHGSAEFFNVQWGGLKAKAEGARFVRCISQFCRGQVMAWTDSAAWERFVVVHCGVDLERYRPRPAQRDGTLRLLTVGRLDPIKGYPLLLKACRKLADRGVSFELDMVGDGPVRGLLEKMIGEMRLQSFVKLSGAVGQDEIGAHFDRADVMVISSFMEGIPVVLMEAMAKELAVVSTRVAGVPELVKEGETGLLVTVGSVDEMTEALERLANDRGMIQRMGKAGREQVAAEFSIGIVGKEMAGLFRKYVGSAVRNIPSTNAFRTAEPTSDEAVCNLAIRR